MKTRLRIARRITVLTMVAALCSVLAYGAGWAMRSTTLPWEDAEGADVVAMGDQSATAPGTDGTDGAEPRTPAPRPRPAEPAAPAEPTPPKPGPALLSPGDRGDDVRDLQARLKQIDWFSGDVTGNYGEITTASVRGFQAKRGFAVTGEVDRRTLDRLHTMTRQPTQAELTNQPPPSSADNRAGALDPRCTTGRVLCVDKSSRTLRWVVDGQVRRMVDVRFGSEELPTREGAFSVQRKSRDHVSSLYDTPMPYAMFFSGGQAVHYSPDFAANGYAGASHGCVNVRDEDAVAWLFDQVQVGDAVIVYWS